MARRSAARPNVTARDHSPFERVVRPSAQTGFTLTELLIVIAIMGIVAAFAGPNLRPLLVRNAVAGHANTLTSAIWYARSEAVARGSAVSICRAASADLNSCGAAGSDWSTGWIVFADGGALGQINPGDARLRVFSAVDTGYEILANAGDGGAGFAALTWGSTGELVNRPAGDGMPRLTVKSKVSSEASMSRLVCLSASGRARLSSAAGNCAGN